MDTFKPKMPNSMKREERHKFFFDPIALQLINLIKEKRDRTIIGRTCVDC